MADDQISNPNDNVAPEPDSTVATPLPTGDNPVSEPDDLPEKEKDDLDRTHPSTDTNIQPEEEYDEGISGAAEASEPNQNNAVKNYKSPQDNQGE